METEMQPKCFGRIDFSKEICVKKCICNFYCSIKFQKLLEDPKNIKKFGLKTFTLQELRQMKLT
jgi:hypothetical protein